MTANRFKRLALFLSVPVLLLLVGGYLWYTGGRYVGTENAYVQRDLLSVSAEVSGRITEVAVEVNDRVTAGQLLFRIDPVPYRLALAKAEAELAAARLEVEQLRAVYGEKLAAIATAREDVAFLQTEFKRRKELRAKGHATEADYDRARHALVMAEQRLVTEKRALANARAALGGDPETLDLARHPLVLEARAERDRAQLDLDRTTVRAPVAGVVSQGDRLLPGQYVIAGAPMLSIVDGNNSWIEANYKETDLTHMAVGQKATVVLDAYPDRKFTAEVIGIGAATGAEFALLPPQNATGNWVKVVQRVPVRLRITDPNAAAFLPAGLSADVTVDTKHRRLLPRMVESALAWTSGR